MESILKVIVEVESILKFILEVESNSDHIANGVSTEQSTFRISIIGLLNFRVNSFRDGVNSKGCSRGGVNSEVHTKGGVNSEVHTRGGVNSDHIANGVSTEQSTFRISIIGLLNFRVNSFRGGVNSKGCTRDGVNSITYKKLNQSLHT